jgi:hypothetical protein
MDHLKKKDESDKAEECGELESRLQAAKKISYPCTNSEPMPCDSSSIVATNGVTLWHPAFPPTEQRGAPGGQQQRGGRAHDARA